MKCNIIVFVVNSLQRILLVGLFYKFEFEWSIRLFIFTFMQYLDLMHSTLIGDSCKNYVTRL